LEKPQWLFQNMGQIGATFFFPEDVIGGLRLDYQEQFVLSDPDGCFGARALIAVRS
jgi:hypothetical protein